MSVFGIAKKGLGLLGKKKRDPKRVTLKPLSERKQMGKKTMESRIAGIKAEQKYSYPGKKLDARAKRDIERIQGLRKINKRAAKESAAGGAAVGGLLYAADKVGKMEKKKKNDKKNKK